ncbi:hypothetical protein D9M72_350610 [compost metagenome]
MVDCGPLAGTDGDVARGHSGCGGFKHRRIHDPAECPVGGVDQAGAVSDFDAGGTEEGAGRRLLAGGKEDAVSGLGADGVGEAGTLGIREVLGYGTGQFAVFLEEDVGEALGPALLGPFLPGVQRPACLRGPAGHDHCTDVGRLEHAEVGVLEELGELGQLQAEAQVRLVRAVACHRVGVGDALDGRRNLDIDQLPQGFDDAFAERNDVILLDEARFDVQLGEFRLAVRAEVLIAVATRDLVVLLEPAHLQELLEKLRGLRQRVPGTRREACGDHEVAGAFRRRTRERGCFDLHVTVAVEQFAGHAVGLGAQAHVAGGARAAQVEVAVLEAGFLAHLDVLVDLEGQRIRGVEDGHLLGDDLDLAGGQRRVFVTLRTLRHRTDDLQDVLIAESVKDLFFADDHLGDARGIAKVNECHTTVITTPAHPAGQGYGLSNVLGAKGSEVMCAQHSTPFLGRQQEYRDDVEWDR